MDLTQLIEDKTKEIHDIRASLERLTANLETSNESIPPLWNGDLKQLNKFVDELEEWVKSPKINRAKRLIEIIKKQASDKRSFKGLDESYLMGNQVGLEDAAKLVKSIKIEQLRCNVAKRVLDHLQEQDDIAISVKGISDFCIDFSQFANEAVDNDFIKAVKEDLVESLSTLKDIDSDEIENARTTIKKAREAFDLLKSSGITQQTYFNCYEETKSVDTLWDYASNVRDLLNKTNIVDAANMVSPLDELKRINVKRKQCLKKSNLREVYKGLQETAERIEKWRGQVKAIFKEKYGQIKVIVEMTQIDVDLDEISQKFDSIVDTFTDVEEISNLYLEMYDARDKALKVLETRITNPNERRIVENMTHADDLIEEMGPEFWEALQTLRKTGLVKIRLEKGQ